MSMSESLNPESTRSNSAESRVTDTATSLLFIKTFAVGPLRCNCTIIGDPVSKQAIVADPGGDADVILRILAEEGLTVKRIIHTHAHFDQTAGARASVNDLRRRVRVLPGANRLVAGGDG